MSIEGGKQRRTGLGVAGDGQTSLVSCGGRPGQL